MKLFVSILLLSSIAKADGITVSIDGVYNVAKSTVLEVCGTATSKTGKWPIAVSLTHEGSVYTTLTSKDNHYCQLIARQSWKGEVSAVANSMDGAESSSSVQFLEK